MFCTSCGNERLPQDAFCSRCGSAADRPPVAPPEAQVTSQFTLPPPPPAPPAAPPSVLPWDAPPPEPYVPLVLPTETHGTAGRATPASFGQRLGARLLDGLVLAVPTAVLWAVFFGSLGIFGTPEGSMAILGPLVVVVAASIAGFVYLQVCDTTGGRTVGRAALGIRVVSLPDEGRLRGGQAFGRRLVQGLGEMLFGLGALAMLWHPERRTWGDRASGTAVLRDSRDGSPRGGLVWASGVVAGAAVLIAALVALPSSSSDDFYDDSEGSALTTDGGDTSGDVTSAPTQESAPVSPAEVRQVALEVTTPGQAPDGVDAAGNATSYAPANLLDGDPTTTWREIGDGTGHVLTIALDGVDRISSVGMVNGYAKTDPTTGVDRYHQERIVLRATWTIGGVSFRQELRDTRELQLLDIRTEVGDSTVFLRLDAVSAPGDPAFDYTAISELVVNGS